MFVLRAIQGVSTKGIRARKVAAAGGQWRAEKPTDRRQSYTDDRTMPKYLKSLSKEEVRKFVDSFDVILSDCDGVLWVESDVISGSPEAVRSLKKAGKKFFYVTNNNAKTRAEYATKCQKLKYDATKEEIVCTAYLAAMYLKERKFDRKVYIVGNVGIAQELEAVGIRYTGLGPDTMKGDLDWLIENFKPDPEVGAVIVGFDEDFSYPKLAKAATYLQDPNVLFIGTNGDIDRPSPNSNKCPGTGVFVRVVEIASKRRATIVGKPEPYISQYLISQYGLNPSRTLMIGDNRTTDILVGKRCGFTTLLVLTGVTSAANINGSNENENNEELAVPDYYTDRLSDIINIL